MNLMIGSNSEATVDFRQCILQFHCPPTHFFVSFGEKNSTIDFCKNTNKTDYMRINRKHKKLLLCWYSVIL